MTNTIIFQAIACLVVGSVVTIFLRMIGLILYSRFFPYKCNCEIRYLQNGKKQENECELHVEPNWNFNIRHLVGYRFFVKVPISSLIYVVELEKIGNKLRTVNIRKPKDSKITSYGREAYELEYDFLEKHGVKYYEIHISVHRDI